MECVLGFGIEPEYLMKHRLQTIRINLTATIIYFTVDLENTI